MLAFYADHFVLPLPHGHRFPMSKYSRLRQRVAELGLAELHVPEPISNEAILRCHTPDYLHRVSNGLLSAAEQRRIGFPWSPQMVERCRRTCGGTLGAARAALRDGIAVNLAGGTHHAGRDHGEGYCVFNDSPIAARTLQAEGLVRRVVVIDCDVHQGNGTADICRDDPTIFTFSIHGQNNFPFRKISGDLDIGLPNNTGDDDYLAMLEIALERVLYQAQADLALYVSGADPFVGDKLGKLALTKDGLARRDRLVLGMCYERRLPVAVSMAGGYASNVEDIVDIHLQTVAIAAEFAACW
ncbi:MAG: histone deacetylase [Anaerolineae bacterium]|nr:histone deacetylase [Anaerolineae bacterium]MDW8170949.1 histone deacetylase [Anaerolineae bacterium]